MTTQIRLRSGTTQEWSSVNPVLASAEVGVDTSVNNVKVGDGVTAWNSLPYLVPVGVQLVDSGTSIGQIQAMNLPAGTVIFEKG